MSSINNIHKYKKAKKLVPELQAMVFEIESTITRMNKYKRYLAIQQILEILTDNRILLKAHLKEQTEILNSKGKEESNGN